MAENWKELTENNIGLVYHVVDRHKRKLNGYSVYRAEDLVAEGSLALITAAKKFDPDRGVPFSSYACACIDGALKNFVNKVAPIVTYSYRGAYVAAKIVRDGNEHDSDEELMEKYNISKTIALAAKEFIKNKYYISLNNEAQGPDNDDADELLDLYIHYNEDFLSDMLFDKLYNSLTEKEKRVVIGRLVGETNLEIGRSMGVSGEMVRIHIKKIRKKFDRIFCA